MARLPRATDLTQTTNLSTLSGTPVVEVAEATLKAGASLVGTWSETEPIVKTLIALVKDYVETGDVKPHDAAKLLSQCATVIQKLSMASTGVLRASEGMSKLALLLDAGTVKRSRPEDMTQKQLVAAVVGTVQKLVIPGKQCPACHVLVPLEVQA